MRAAELRVGDLNMQNLANTAWAFAATKQSDAQLFAALAVAAQHLMCDFNALELANIAWAITIVSWSDALIFMSRVLSSADVELGSAKWAVSITGSSITNEPIEMSLRNCLSANVKELASSELAMHGPLMSWIASMDSDCSVHFAKQIHNK